MDTILNYLENMFVNLPQNKEVLRAKKELSSMMEDKYNELLADGKSDNEAVGIVISEFGNLKEIAAELGIESVYHEDPVDNKGKVVSDSEAKKYLNRVRKSSVGIGIGVLLCICSPALLIVLAGMQEERYQITDTMLVAFGLGSLFVMIAVAVGLFIYNGSLLDKFGYMKKEKISLSVDSVNYVRDYKEKTESSFLLKIVMGVMLCIVSVIPLIIVGVAFSENDMYCCMMVGVMLFMIGVAVFLFIIAGMEHEALNVLLQEGEFTLEKKENSKKSDVIGGIYWPIITCIYLAWSFISNNWGTTWIVWPIAGVLFAAITGIVNAIRGNGNC